ncbi:hypothetical protein BASA81_007549 [Batrachochytrium salamandrivorans]|nr:hypothetical protein BASA81_007549 [Batrachochytrium salamandrivorans]
MAKAPASRAQQYARRLQASLLVLCCALLLAVAGALFSRPQTFSTLLLWFAALAVFFSTDESSVLHKSQEEENKFWTLMAFSLALFLLFVAGDSPLLLPRSAVGLGAGLVVLFGLAFGIHLAHKRSHSAGLRKKTTIPRNASYRSVVSALGRDSPVALRKQVLDLVFKLENPSGSFFAAAIATSEEETTVEEEILQSFERASRAELNHLAMNEGLTATLYHLRNHLGGVQYRDLLLKLLCETRVQELTTSAKVSVLDTLQSLGGFVHNSPAAQQWAAQILLHTHGPALSRLKTLSDAKGCVRSMHRLVFHDFSNSQVRQSVLKHFECNATIERAGRKVVSDIDDTFLCSGNKYPAGMDASFKRHTVYPGAGAFLEALDYGTEAPNSRETVYDASTSLLPEHQVVVGNLVFLSARPHLYKDVSEKQVYNKFAKFIQQGKLHTMPTLLSGDLGSGRMFMLMGDYRPMAAKKCRNMLEYYAIYPDYTHVFVGDNGQGDVLAAEMIKETLGDSLEAVYIHLVQPLESTFGFDSRAKWRWICFYHTFVGAAVHAYTHKMITTLALRTICQSATRDFIQLKAGEKQRFLLVCDLEQANKHLTAAGEVAEAYPPASGCLFPVGSKVFVWTGIEGVVEGFRVEDGVYKIRLFGGHAVCYLTALSSGLVAEAVHVQQHVESGQPPCEVTTPYGVGIVEHFRAEDKIYQVKLTQWHALAYLREEDVQFATQQLSASDRIWTWGKQLLLSSPSSAAAGLATTPTEV